MRVKDVMMRTVANCRAETNLGAAVETMWKRNCGILPVVDAKEKLIGVVTDRDICIALGTRNQRAGEIAVKDVARWNVHCCGPEDDVRSALETMAECRIHRLPVINTEGTLEGILSMDDIVFHAETRNVASELSAEHVLNALKAVCAPGLPQIAAKKRAAA
jgi:CBS domain-containing protein